MAPLLIADVPWLLYRSYFALPKSIVDGEGRPVNALLGTVNALLAVMRTHPVRAVAACMGAEQATYRVELYPPYHAHREPMPAELAFQFDLAPRLLESLHWSVPSSEDLEADDVMFSLTRLEVAAGGQALLLTGDRDLFQVVGEGASIVELSKGTVAGEIGPAQVRERYGIGPELVADFIALRGDPSDGLPGAPGVGAKTAAELLREYGSLEELLQAAGKATSGIRPRIVQALRENTQLLLDFKRIATLVEIELERPSDRATDFAAGALQARALGMVKLAERLQASI